MNVEFFDKTLNGIEEFARTEFAKHSLEKIGEKRKPFSCAIREDDTIIAIGNCFGEDCYISDIVVSKNYRSKGLGKKILEEIEKLALNSNCSSIIVDTLEYQAPSFYIKNNFETIGQIDNYHKGHARIFYKKVIKK